MVMIWPVNGRSMVRVSFTYGSLSDQETIMAETRARPARERQRFMQLARANAWFYVRMSKVEDPSWDMLRDWEACQDSLKIRRFNNANPQDCHDLEQEVANEFGEEVPLSEREGSSR